ncbi:glycosyltransferase family 2 protein [Candidatus Parcubacteria bacterium]|nr:glycosyltransferase family 2 protein [Candidatus Parcubacteria bacterium]MBI4099084.1 glycosyltransferase family 2 protein [Candidatus Parcubacteria bacterium]MBI4385343.1 glycosyltransferase family 2 protein [Candidatus Parcubacteria bacterium]
MLTEKKISVVIPCYNDRGSIHEMYRRVNAVMQDVTPNYEFVYVNDASPDDAIEVLRQFAAKDKRFVVVDHSRNFGKEAACAAGLMVCTGDAAILLDGDLEDPPELFPEFVKNWLEGYEVVYGVRARRRANPIKRIGYKIFYRIFRKLSYLKMPLDAGDFGLIDRKVIEVLNRMPETDRFFRGLRAWAGFRSAGIPYARAERFSGKSASGIGIYLRAFKRGIFSFSYAPLGMISLLAVVMSVLSFAALIAYVAIAIAGASPAPRGFLTQVVLMLVLSAMQFLCLAVIAEYVGRIFEETKRRPQYVIREILNDPRQNQTQTQPA